MIQVPTIGQGFGLTDLTLLAPDIQEALLFLPTTDGGRGAAGERLVRRICAVADWRKQRRMWQHNPRCVPGQRLGAALSNAAPELRRE